MFEGPLFYSFLFVVVSLALILRRVLQAMGAGDVDLRRGRGNGGFISMMPMDGGGHYSSHHYRGGGDCGHHGGGFDGGCGGGHGH